MGFEPTISAGERPQIYALYRAATGTDKVNVTHINKALCNYFSNKLLSYVRTNLNVIQLVRYCYQRPNNMDVS